MQIFKEFGVNPILLVAQIVNFLIILFVLKKFLYKPVLDMIKKRQEEIESGLRNSDKARLTLEKTLVEEKEILQKAQIRAGKITDQAKIEAIETKNSAEESAKKESEALVNQARLQIAEEIKLAEEKLTKNIGSIAISLLEKSLQGLFGKKEQEVLLKRADEQIRKSKIT